MGWSDRFFDFDAENETVAIGLYSARMCGGKKLLVTDLPLKEWKAIHSTSQYATRPKCTISNATDDKQIRLGPPLNVRFRPFRAPNQTIRNRPSFAIMQLVPDGLIAFVTWIQLMHFEQRYFQYLWQVPQEP